ncbi:MAG: S8 family peptidase [Pseudarcicella sp.]|nr:S8 family peptidase [Pseudarcicella sp.]MBP6411613.1 S8 family peptidase [Pseudarcicella sp.]
MNLKFTPIIILFFFIVSFQTKAQNDHKYLFLLKDKNNNGFDISKPEQFLSQRAIERRKKQKIAITPQDLPVTKAYTEAIKSQGAKIWYTSKWINGVVAQCDSLTMQKIKKLAFVKGIEGDKFLESPYDSCRFYPEIPDTDEISDYQIIRNGNAINYGDSKNQLEMLGIDQLHKQGFRGEGMMIGVLDDGFRNAQKVPYLKTVFDEKRIVSTFNFTRNQKGVYNDGGHGTNVLSIIAADLEGELYGGAYKSSYVLMVTEDEHQEALLEEANMLIALEYADSTGVDVLNASLGYVDFDDETVYSYEQRDGNTTLAARAADWAAAKGMVFVVSAGNSGSGDHISTPADADSVLTVGSVMSNREYHEMTSIGPRTDGVIKPDVMAKGSSTTIGYTNGEVGNGNGTSFAAPLVTSFVATFWQANPEKTAFEIIQSIRKSGNYSTSPSPLMGFGIPNLAIAKKYLLNPEDFMVTGTESKPLKFEISPNPFTNKSLPKITLKEKNNLFSAWVLDLQGKVVWQAINLKSSEILPLEHLKIGEYILKIANGKATATHKLVKAD